MSGERWEVPGRAPAVLPVARPLVTIHLPLEMGAVAEIMEVVARVCPDAQVASGSAAVTVNDRGEDITYSTTRGHAYVLMGQVPE